MWGRASITDAAAVTVLAAGLCALALFGNPLLSPDYFADLWSDPDVAWQSYPNKALVRRALLDGRLPLGNPHVLAGMPFAGNPQAQLFYPPTLLFLPGVRFGLGASLLLHAALAFLGAYLLAKQELPGDGAARPAALLAGIVYAFSGAMVTQIQQTAIFQTSAWIPLFLWGLLSGRPVRAAVVTAGLLLAGHTQIASYALLVGGLLLLLRPAQGMRPRLAGAAGAATGFALAAAMLLPAAELLTISMRGRGVSEGFAGVNAFQDWHFPLVFNPAAYSGLSGDRYWTYPFAGTATLLLLLVALLPPTAGRSLPRILWIATAALLAARPALGAFVTATKGWAPAGGFYLRHWDLLVLLGKGNAWTTVLVPLAVLLLLRVLAPTRATAWGIALLLSLGLALGPEAPLLGGLFHLPVLGEARGAVRFLHLYALMAAVLAALGAHRALSWGGRLARATVPLPFFYLLAITLTTWRQSHLTLPFGLSLLCGGAWIAVLRFRAEPGGHVSPAARFVPHAVLLMELLTFGTDAGRVTDPRLYGYGDPDRLIAGRDPGARILVLREGDLGCFETSFNHNAGMVLGYDGALGYEPLALRSATELVNVARTLAVYEPGTGRLADLRDVSRVGSTAFLHDGSLAVARLLRARYVIAKGADLLDPTRRLPVSPVGPGPARRSLRLGDETRECLLLPAPSETLLYLQGGREPMQLRYSVGPDPRIVDPGGWPGVDVTITVRRGPTVLATDRVEVDPAADPRARRFQHRTLHVPSAGDDGEIGISLQVAPRGLGLQGFNWVGATMPVVTVDDPGRAARLAARLRPLGGRGLDAACPDPEGRTAPVWVYELTDALPVAVAPRRISGADAAASLADPAFDPAETLLFPGAAPRELSATRIVSAHAEGMGATVRYEAAAPTWLLVTNAHLPGLVARVDGAPAPTARADLHFTAVEVPAGSRTLELRYLPGSVRLGLFVSLGALAALVGSVSASLPRPPGVPRAPSG